MGIKWSASRVWTDTPFLVITLRANTITSLIAALRSNRSFRGGAFFMCSRMRAGHLLQRQLRFGRQAGQLRDQKVHHIIAVTLGVNAIEIPGPACSIMIKGEHSFIGERSNELNGEERIAARLLVHQSRERCTAFRL